MDEFKKLAGRAGLLCIFWRCFENEGADRGDNRRRSRRIARHRMKRQLDMEVQRGEHECST